MRKREERGRDKDMSLSVIINSSNFIESDRHRFVSTHSLAL